jgi:hypothetical protein
MPDLGLTVGTASAFFLKSFFLSPFASFASSC